jgi:hypothetical protein
MDNGCTIYADRPGSCRHFSCLWLQGYLEQKPNENGHLVWISMVEGYPHLFLDVLPGFEQDDDFVRELLVMTAKLPVMTGKIIQVRRD